MAEAEEKLEVEGCGFLCVHEKVVEKGQHELPQEETLLTDSVYQERVAWNIFMGIMQELKMKKE